jgi:hypothetical protein
VFSIIFFVHVFCWSVKADNKPPSTAIKKLQALAGDWEGKDDGGMAAKPVSSWSSRTRP